MSRILVTRSSMPEYEEYIEEIKDIWDSHWLTNMGAKHNELEKELEAAVRKARIGGLTAQEICETFQIIMEDGEC